MFEVVNTPHLLAITNWQRTKLTRMMILYRTFYYFHLWYGSNMSFKTILSSSDGATKLNKILMSYFNSWSLCLLTDEDTFIAQLITAIHSFANSSAKQSKCLKLDTPASINVREVGAAETVAGPTTSLTTSSSLGRPLLLAWTSSIDTWQRTYSTIDDINSSDLL
jgi:hypothetical protein